MEQQPLHRSGHRCFSNGAATTHNNDKETKVQVLPCRSILRQFFRSRSSGRRSSGRFQAHRALVFPLPCCTGEGIGASSMEQQPLNNNDKENRLCARHKTSITPHIGSSLTSLYSSEQTIGSFYGRWDPPSTSSVALFFLFFFHFFFFPTCPPWLYLSTFLHVHHVSTCPPFRKVTVCHLPLYTLSRK